MVLQEKVKVDARTIDDFCRATFDTNDVHDSAKMHQRGLYSIVPGMFTLTKSFLLAQNVERIQPHRPLIIEVNFGTALREGEEIAFEVVRKSEAPLEVMLSAKGGRGDALAGKEYPSVLKLVPNIGSLGVTNGRDFSLQGETYGDFVRTVGEGDSAFTKLAYAIACSSRPILQSLSSPQTSAERVVKGLMDSGHLPVYSNLKVQKMNEAVLKDTANIGYKVHVDFDGNKTIYVNTLAKDEWKELFTVSAELTLCSEKIIYRKVATKLPAEYRT